jgi:UDP-2,3-diacylglucosamine hydrolase
LESPSLSKRDLGRLKGKKLVTYLFISDLHLSPEHPRLVRGFLDLLDSYKDRNTQLYILGDWFNAWIGDDYSAPWLDEIVLAGMKQHHSAS